VLHFTDNNPPTQLRFDTMASAGDRYETRTGNIWSYAHRGDLTGLKAAVSRGVDVNIVNTVGWTACHAAAAGGQTKALRYLVKKMDADLSITDNGGNLPVHHAAKNGHVHALRTLQELGANVTKVRLSHTKGKAVRDFVIESYRVQNKEVDNYDTVEAVGYSRKQSKSTAFWGPRRTPISCAVKKKIIKDKRKIRKEKYKAKLENDDAMEQKDQECELTNIDEMEESKTCYIETVQQIKRRKKQKRRQRQKSHTCSIEKQRSIDESPLEANKTDKCKFNDTQLNAVFQKELSLQDSINEEEGNDDDCSNADDVDDVRFLTSNRPFAALALLRDDSDSD